ncbi:MAG: hypothetical protein IJI06_01830 [Oscillospiraceae bacterium]|nr:hypothetical protein [Oscillospiraceae bacterium]
MLLELAACGPPAPQGGEAPDVSVPEDVAATVEPTPEPYVVPGDLTLAINEVMPSNKATLAVDGAFPTGLMKNIGSEAMVYNAWTALHAGRDRLLLRRSALLSAAKKQTRTGRLIKASSSYVRSVTEQVFFF